MSKHRKTIVPLLFIMAFIMTIKVVKAQQHTVEGEILDGNNSVVGVMVTVVVQGKLFNSPEPTKEKGKYAVTFPDSDRIKIVYEPAGSAYFPMTIKDASGRRDHRISVVLRSTQTALSASEANDLFQHFIENAGAVSPERKLEYAAIIDLTRIDSKSVIDATHYYTLQMKNTEARRVLGLKPSFLFDGDHKAMAPPPTTTSTGTPT